MPSKEFLGQKGTLQVVVFTFDVLAEYLPTILQKMKTGCFIEYLREMENLLFLSSYPLDLARSQIAPMKLQIPARIVLECSSELIVR